MSSGVRALGQDWVASVWDPVPAQSVFFFTQTGTQGPAECCHWHCRTVFTGYSTVYWQSAVERGRL